MFTVRDDAQRWLIAQRGLRPMRAYRNILCLSVLSITMCGCASFWHDLKPHRMHRINRVPPPSWDPEFSQTSASSALNLVRHDHPATPSRLSANQAEVILARGQNSQ